MLKLRHLAVAVGSVLLAASATPRVNAGSSKKIAEHGGFSHDDTNVIMLLSNPRISASTISASVTTMQVAPTILSALGLNPESLQAVQIEGTQVLPGSGF